MLQQPIKLNILSKDGNNLIKYIFIGDNAHVKKILSKPKKINKLGVTVLKNYYGSDWRKVLCVDYFGGAENDVDDTGELEPDEHITLDDIYALDTILDDTPETQPIQRNSKIKIQYIFEDVVLNTFDNVLEFKQKIALFTHIPIYKQNISYNYNSKVYNLNYDIYIQNSIVHVSIFNSIINNKQVELINDIPILINFYNIKNTIRIKTQDTFSILDNFITLGITEFNLFNLDDFINSDELKITTNKNQLEIIFYGFVSIFWPMLSFEVWVNYINSTRKEFIIMYPDITTVKKEVFVIEQHITSTALQLLNNKSLTKQKNTIEKHMFIGITSASIKVQSANTQNIINLRNLFDNLQLNDTMVSCKCALLYNQNTIFLNKTYKNHSQLTNILINNCIMIKVVGTTWINFELYIYTNGTYVVKSRWFEDKLYNFTDILIIVSKTVNKIIKYINEMGNIVTLTNYTLEPMSEKNHKFSDIYVSLIYRNPIKFHEFKIIENILKEYTNAGIVDLHEINNETNTLQYYFRKGMYKFNSDRIDTSIVVNNHYNFLTNHIIKSKWSYLFQHTRNTTFQYRHGDIKISIEGIKDEEFNTFYMYIINIFNMVEIQKLHYVPEKIVKLNLKHNVKTLKYQDPLLYDFKKLYNSPVVYSRLCQKKNQPIILSNEEYNILAEDKKKAVLKYWNFTTKSPAYYQCPNPKYPHIQFTIKKHPDNFCIPCCKVKPILDDNTSEKQIIYNTCLEKHIYTSEKITTVSDVKYIMSYGKYIMPGRICHLPEQTLEPLFYESFSDNYKGLQASCKNKYYIYGIAQDTKYTKDIGYVATLAFVQNLTISALVEHTITLLKTNPNYFKTIINGKILKYFKTVQDLTYALQDTFIDNNLQNTNAPWNLIFIDIAYYYFTIATIIFEDLSVSSREYIKLQITNKTNNVNLLGTQYKSLIVVKKHKIYNPIFDIDTNNYFKTKEISKMIFTNTDNAISIISKINIFNNSEVENKTQITLQILETCVQQIKVNEKCKYTINTLFINAHNLCYYVQITSKMGTCYIPVTFSVYASDAVDFAPLQIKTHVTTFKLLNEFIKDFNHWIATRSEKKQIITSAILEQNVIPLYNFIIVHKWIYLHNPWQNNKSTTINDKNIIGFICNGINYYHEPITYTYIRTISKAPLERILYHPDMVNTHLHNTAAVSDLRVQNITKNLYDYHLYELLLLEYIALLNKEKNTDIRHAIKKQIIKRDETNSEQIITNIKQILNVYYAQYTEFAESCEVDTNKLIIQINNYVIKHRDKSQLLTQIDITNYNFDKLKINSFKVMPKDKLITELLKISKQIVIIVKDSEINKALHNIEEFPNMFISCQNNNSTSVYCKQNKLVITSTNLQNLLNIMAADILNPFKSKFFFNALFTDNIINYLKFIKRPDEYIEIQSR